MDRIGLNSTFLCFALQKAVAVDDDDGYVMRGCVPAEFESYCDSEKDLPLDEGPMKVKGHCCATDGCNQGVRALSSFIVPFCMSVLAAALQRL